MWKRYEKVTNYTLQELITSVKPSCTINAVVARTATLANMLYETPWGTEDFQADTGEVWRMVYARVGDNHCTKAIGDAAYANLLNHLVPMLLDTEAKYVPVLRAYQIALSKENALMEGIGSKNKSRNWFNDTPQDLSPEGEDLNHLTTFSKNDYESVNDGYTPMGRLAEIQSNISSVKRTWENEIIARMGWEHDDE